MAGTKRHLKETSIQRIPPVLKQKDDNCENNESPDATSVKMKLLSEEARKQGIRGLPGRASKTAAETVIVTIPHDELQDNCASLGESTPSSEVYNFLARPLQIPIDDLCVLLKQKGIEIVPITDGDTQVVSTQTSKDEAARPPSPAVQSAGAPPPLHSTVQAASAESQDSKTKTDTRKPEAAEIPPNKTQIARTSADKSRDTKAKSESSKSVQKSSELEDEKNPKEKEVRRPGDPKHSSPVETGGYAEASSKRSSTKQDKEKGLGVKSETKGRSTHGMQDDPRRSALEKKSKSTHAEKDAPRCDDRENPATWKAGKKSPVPS